jgi:hypothetical protein
MLTELRNRATAVTVVQAADEMKIEADHAYVIPAERDDDGH